MAEKKAKSSDDDVQLSSAENKDPKKPSAFDHGEKSDVAKAQEKAEKKAADDPWGDTPMQMRDKHDPAVDPKTDDKAPAAAPLSGIAPESVEGGPTGGTLPPV